jgi:hypothetical protein
LFESYNIFIVDYNKARFYRTAAIYVLFLKTFPYFVGKVTLSRLPNNIPTNCFHDVLYKACIMSDPSDPIKSNLFVESQTHLLGCESYQQALPVHTPCLFTDVF